MAVLLSPILVSFIAESAWSYPPAASNYSAQKVDISLPCFIQTSDGKVLNLDNLYRGNEQKGESPAAPSDENCFDRSEQQPVPSEDEPKSQTEQARSDR